MTAGSEGGAGLFDRKREVHAHFVAVLTEHLDKARQAEQRPSLRGWFLGQLMIAISGRDAFLAQQVVDEHFAPPAEWPVFVFRRQGSWYPVALPSVYDIPANVKCNPGTIRVEDTSGNVLWPILAEVTP